jgi:hypothetical protein
MGLNNSQSESVVFLAIANGKIVRQYQGQTRWVEKSMRSFMTLLPASLRM